MKAYQCCVQESHPLFVGVAAAGRCDFTAITSKSKTTAASRRKRLTSKGHNITSKYGAVLVPFCPPHHLYITKLLNSRRGNSCTCFCSVEAEYCEADLPLNGEPNAFSSHSDSISEEERECSGYGDADSNSDSELLSQVIEEDGFGIQIEKTGKRSRRIEASIQISADLSTVWNILTDYERLADFIPGLAVSRLLEKKDNCARLFQIGSQDLALGLKFNAKAILDCFEKDLEVQSFGRSRDIEFKMVEGDFETFEGKWSIEQNDGENCEAIQTLDRLEGQDLCTRLSYVLEVKPKLWLPVRLVEGRLCAEIRTNLACIRQEAQARTSL